MHRAHDADAHVRPRRADEHQRVARPRAEPRADVERRADAEEDEAGDEQPGAPASGQLARSLDDPERLHEHDEEADQNGVRDRPEARPASRAARRGRARPRATSSFATPERERRVLGDPLVQHVPRRQAEARLEERDDAAGAEEQAGDEPDRTRGPPATQDGSRVHRRTLVERARSERAS